MKWNQLLLCIIKFIHLYNINLLFVKSNLESFFHRDCFVVFAGLSFILSNLIKFHFLFCFSVSLREEKEYIRIISKIATNYKNVTTCDIYVLNVDTHLVWTILPSLNRAFHFVYTATTSLLTVGYTICVPSKVKYHSRVPLQNGAFLPTDTKNRHWLNLTSLVLLFIKRIFLKKKKKKKKGSSIGLLFEEKKRSGIIKKGNAKGINIAIDNYVSELIVYLFVCERRKRQRCRY